MGLGPRQQVQLAEMLYALGDRVTGAAKTAGKKLKQFDDRYAEVVRDTVMPSKPDSSPMSAFRGMAGATMGAPLGHGLADISDDPRLVNQLLKYGVPAVSATTRYVLPAAGLTYAGQELSQLINSLSDNERPE